MQRLSALGKMVASLAHQVRTPLSAAMLYAANLSSEKLNPTARSNFHEKLMSRLQDLESQVNDMLLFARSGDQKIVEEVKDKLESPRGAYEQKPRIVLRDEQPMLRNLHHKLNPLDVNQN